MIANLREPTELYAEETPLEELQMTDNDRLIDVFHYHRDPSKFFGIPFRFVVKYVCSRLFPPILGTELTLFDVCVVGRTVREDKGQAAGSSRGTREGLCQVQVCAGTYDDLEDPVGSGGL